MQKIMENVIFQKTSWGEYTLMAPMNPSNLEVDPKNNLCFLISAQTKTWAAVSSLISFVDIKFDYKLYSLSQIQLPSLGTQTSLYPLLKMYIVQKTTKMYTTVQKTNTRDRQLRLKPALVQDTDYMVEKTYQLAPYVGAFGAYLIPQ